MIISSPAFNTGEKIPSGFTCDGADISVPLEWSDVPENTKSLALIMDDPDAPIGTWIHWIVYNIPPSISGFTKNQPQNAELHNGIMQGLNSWPKTGYGGPRPPGGTHRYFFKLYALDCILESRKKITKRRLLKEMEGHIIEKAEMFGTYSRK